MSTVTAEGQSGDVPAESGPLNETADKEKPQQQQQQRGCACCVVMAKCLRSRSSLVFSPHIPLVLRLLVPLLAIGNIGFFVNSNASIGADVSAYFTFGSTRSNLGSLFSFSLSNSVQDMWDAKVYALAVLIAVRGRKQRQERQRERERERHTHSPPSSRPENANDNKIERDFFVRIFGDVFTLQCDWFGFVRFFQLRDHITDVTHDLTHYVPSHSHATRNDESFCRASGRT